MRNIKRLPTKFSIPLNPDQDGYLGRECPECEQYFKITPGTGITEGEPSCHCPYCGYCADPDQFFTKAQIGYAKSVVMKQVSSALVKDLKSLEFDIKPKGAFGIGMSMKVKSQPVRLRHYSETKLEEEVVCDNCTLRYSVFGSFAYCPDCGRHNSRQILDKNIELALKMINLANDVDAELGKQLIADALENGVSAFDGFGREVCRVHRNKASEPNKAEKISFQNLIKSQPKVVTLWGIDLRNAIDASDWEFVTRCFQKRHLLAHKMGVVDDAYMQTTNDPNAVVGRKVSITADEVCNMLGHLAKLGVFLSDELQKLP